MPRRTQPKLTQQQRATLAKHIRKVLKDACKNPQNKHVYLTAYQILDSLPTRVRNRLILVHGLGGKGSNYDHGATWLVSNVAQTVTKDVVYFDTRKTQFEVKGGSVTPAGSYCGLFRLIPQARRQRSSSGTTPTGRQRRGQS